jgi:hypothetical protein
MQQQPARFVVVTYHRLLIQRDVEFLDTDVRHSGLAVRPG